MLPPRITRRSTFDVIDKPRSRPRQTNDDRNGISSSLNQHSTCKGKHWLFLKKIYILSLMASLKVDLDV